MFLITRTLLEFSTNIAKMPARPPPPTLKCQICDDAADGQHFGVDACRACAAFFRRTIARQMKYICRYENKCEISKGWANFLKRLILDPTFSLSMHVPSLSVAKMF